VGEEVRGKVNEVRVGLKECDVKCLLVAVAKLWLGEGV
jgi:hypothetical protein